MALLASTQALNTVVIGVGNDFRHDDAAGLHVIRALQSNAAISGVTYVESDGELGNLLSIWEQYRVVIVVDAVCSPMLQRVVRIDATHDALPKLIATASSHSFGLVEAIELARKLDQLPEILVIYGIPGARFDIGMDLSPGVQGMVDAVVEQITLELKSWRKQEDSN